MVVNPSGLESLIQYVELTTRCCMTLLAHSPTPDSSPHRLKASGLELQMGKLDIKGSLDLS